MRINLVIVSCRDRIGTVGARTTFDGVQLNAVHKDEKNAVPYSVCRPAGVPFLRSMVCQHDSIQYTDDNCRSVGVYWVSEYSILGTTPNLGGSPSGYPLAACAPMAFTNVGVQANPSKAATVPRLGKHSSRDSHLFDSFRLLRLQIHGSSRRSLAVTHQLGTSGRARHRRTE